MLTWHRIGVRKCPLAFLWVVKIELLQKKTFQKPVNVQKTENTSHPIKHVDFWKNWHM